MSDILKNPLRVGGQKACACVVRTFLVLYLNFLVKSLLFWSLTVTCWRVRRMASRCPTTPAGCSLTSCSMDQRRGPWRSQRGNKSWRRCGMPFRAGMSARGAISTTGKERHMLLSGTCSRLQVLDHHGRKIAFLCRQI